MPEKKKEVAYFNIRNRQLYQPFEYNVWWNGLKRSDKMDLCIRMRRTFNNSKSSRNLFEIPRLIFHLFNQLNA